MSRTYITLAAARCRYAVGGSAGHNKGQCFLRKGCEAVAYDVASVRGLYTSLSSGWTYLNAHDVPQVPERVASAVARSFRAAFTVAPPEPVRGSHARFTPGCPEGETLVADARAAVADLTGATPERVILGPSVQALYLALSAAMRPLFRHNSSVVVSGLDDPRLTSTIQLADAQVRWAQADLATGELPPWQFEKLVDGSTRLVSVPAAHAQLGTVVAVPQVAEAVRGRSRAWLLVDGSAYLPYRPLTFDEFGADIIAVDVAAMGGPQVAALVFRDEAMLNRLDRDMLDLPVAPGLAGGVSAIVEHYAQLAEPRGGHPRKVTRRARLAYSMQEAADYMEHLREDLYTFLGTLPKVHIVGVSGEAAEHTHLDRIPRLTFGVRDVPAETVYQRLVANGMVATLASSSKLLSDMGVDEMGGAVTVSLSPFNTQADVVQLTRTVASLA